MLLVRYDCLKATYSHFELYYLYGWHDVCWNTISHVQILSLQILRRWQIPSLVKFKTGEFLRRLIINGLTNERGFTK